MLRAKQELKCKTCACTRFAPALHATNIFYFYFVSNDSLKKAPKKKKKKKKNTKKKQKKTTTTATATTTTTKRQQCALIGPFPWSDLSFPTLTADIMQSCSASQT